MMVTTLALGAILALHAVAGFVLDGSRSSYAQFRKWNAGSNGTLELEFKTDEPNGLILYTDDGGKYDFFEMKLVEGALRLRYNLGGGAQILTVGRDLHDGHWHKVAVTRRSERTTLGVDGATQTRTSRGKEFMFGKLNTNSEVFIGGLPSSAKLTMFSLPSVAFEERFVGAVRNLVYADEDSEVPRRQTMRSGHKCPGPLCGGAGPRDRSRSGNGTDVCEDKDPCLHGGICISTDSGPICECRNVEYEGAFCEKDKAPSEATFRGSEFISYDLNQTGGEPIVSSQDVVSLHFKTRFPNGLLFYTGDGQDFLNLALKEGGVILTMSLGNGQLEMDIRPNKIRFDDNQWHKLTVHRKVQEISAVTSFCRVSAVVDGVYSDHSHLAGSAILLSSRRVFVGGSQSTHSLPGSKIHNNFVGCMRKVEFSADTMRLNLVELGRSGSKMVSVVGHVAWQCHEAEAADPVTFTTREAHLVLPDWDAARTGTLAFKIRTNEANGLLMFSNGPAAQHPDFFAFEIVEGFLILHLDLGSGPVRVRSSARRVDDGAWHEVVLRRAGRTGRLLVDGDSEDFSTPGESDLLDLSGGLHIGGVGPHISPVKIPSYLWTGALRQGYVGCMRDLVINGNAVDVAGYARQQDSSAVRPSCHVQPAMCSSQPCLNGGLCTEGWNRFECDCSATAFSGPVCGRDAATLTFNGTQHLAVRLPAPIRSQVEDIALRFRTVIGDGLLALAGGGSRGDRLALFLTAGRLRMEIRIGDLEKSIMTGQSLNDNLWHTIKFTRRGSHFNLQLDLDPPARAEKDMGQGNLLEYKELAVGGNAGAGAVAGAAADLRTPGFSGVMQHFRWNGVPYLELARTAYHSPRSLPHFTVTGKFSRREHPLTHHAVTFRSKHTFLGLPALKAYSTTNIFFQFKTRQLNGLILYNGGKEQDFLAIELVNGHLHYIFDLGDGAVRVRDTAKTPLNDDRWHQVSIGRPAVRQHTLTVDDAFAIVTSLGHNEKLDLTGILYLGGVRKEIYQNLPKQVQSRHGFEGCLASLDLNGESPDLLIEAVVPSAQVVSGCEGSQKTKCTHSACVNRGVCVQQWSSSACDCDSTSFTGPTCSDESISFEYGPTGGLITLVYPEERRPEMTDDSIALGFITTKEDAVLLRMDSATSNDYMELEVVEGNVFMVYNLGTSDHPIGDINVRVDDAAYHVLRFTRNGANSTLQVDDYSLQTHRPAGHQLAVFNTQSVLQIGGRWNPAKQRIERPFQGVMSGLVVNGQRVFDLAAEKDPKTSVRGDVQVVTGIHSRSADPFQRMQQTPASNFPGIMDDLVFSGAGSACQNDDEDTCVPVFDTGSGDDLITPVFIPPTRVPPPARKGSPDSAAKPCDDEDCAGSGAGELTTEETGMRGSSTVEGTSPNEIHTGSSPGSWSGPSEVPDSGPGAEITTSVAAGSATSSGTTQGATVTSGTAATGSTTTTTTTAQATEQPELIPELPPVQPPRQPPRPPIEKKPPTTSLAAQNTAVVIGVIAGSMIAVIILILIVLRFKSRNTAAYKLDESKHSQQGPAAALLPPAAEPVLAPALRNGNGRSRKQKDVKEWYV